jgi:hypothetical protein
MSWELKHRQKSYMKYTKVIGTREEIGKELFNMMNTLKTDGVPTKISIRLRWVEDGNRK